MNGRDVESLYKEDKGMNIMPSVEMLESEKVAYINEMKEYLKRLKGMELNEAKKISFANLVKSQIIDENGEFTKYYECMRMNAQSER